MKHRPVKSEARRRILETVILAVLIAAAAILFLIPRHCFEFVCP